MGDHSKEHENSALKRWIERLSDLFFRRRRPPSAPLIKSGEPEHARKGPFRDLQDRYVAPETTQFQPGGTREVLDVVIGLDFGTSSTKVAVRTPFMAGGRTVAIPFGDLAHPSCEYLLPTRLWCGPNGELGLKESVGARSWTNLKIRLLDLSSADDEIPGNDELEAVALSAGYLGLVLRRARQWFLTNEREAYGHFELRWQLNVGIPSAGYDDERIRRMFAITSEAAWQLSTLEKYPSLGGALGAIDYLLKRDRSPSIQTSVIPEVAAEVVGYARSPQRNPGLHVLVDVGASTLDICGFVLSESEGEDQYALLTAEVLRLGAFELHRMRVDAADPKHSDVASLQALSDDLIAPIPEDVAIYVLGADAAAIQGLERIDQDYVVRCANAQMRTIMPLKTRRDPRSPRWEEGLPVFVCGGAGRMLQVQSSIEESNDRLQRATGKAGLQQLSLPVPSNLANPDVDEETFQRLGVAYGLSFDSFDIGKIVPPAEISDIERARPRDWRSGFVDKDMV